MVVAHFNLYCILKMKCFKIACYSYTEPLPLCFMLRETPKRQPGKSCLKVNNNNIDEIDLLPLPPVVPPETAFLAVNLFKPRKQSQVIPEILPVLNLLR
jgi:hypothetical protein